MKKVYILAVSLLMGQSSWAQIRDFQTTRLKSTAGAGVASILSSESAILNPAASTFFVGSSFAYHLNKTSLRRESDERKTNDDSFPNHNTSQGFFLSDHDGPLKGGVAYVTQNENDFKRSQIITHTAAPVGKSTSLGFSYRYVQDQKPRSHSSKKYHTAHTFSAGMTTIVDQDTIIGLVLIDPSRSLDNEERLIAGFQYTIVEKLTLIADIGTQYTKDVMEKHIWRGALQFKLFSDFYLRAGRFYDNVRKERGFGWGASWLGPRIGVEFSQQYSDQLAQNYVYDGEQIVDTSMSVLIKF